MKKLIIIFLIMSLLCFASGNEDDEVTLPETETTTEAETIPETEPQKPGITIAGNDISNYTIVHDGTKAASALAGDLKLLIHEACGCRVNVKKYTAAESE